MTVIHLYKYIDNIGYIARLADITMYAEYRKAQAEIEKKNDTKTVLQKIFKVV